MTKSDKSHHKSAGATPNGSQSIEITFWLEDDRAREVHLSGEFNEWSPNGLPMIRQGNNGQWQKRITLKPGRYEYKFVADGRWVHDPLAAENVANGHGSLNSVVRIGWKPGDPAIGRMTTA